MGFYTFTYYIETMESVEYPTSLLQQYSFVPLLIPSTPPRPYHPRENCDIFWPGKPTRPAVISIVAGLVGMWAVGTHNALAARLYLWSFLPRCLVVLVVLGTQWYRYRLWQGWGSVMVEVADTIILVYYLKVRCCLDIFK